ncbi:MAG: TetR/AcrR family transcriptional regulator [Clostridium sp.]|nr:TetR/AcrR family transcriptional regulator [Clostridium sp.]
MPKNETRDTKEVILTVALKLFSERGYDGVGIRDILKEIGIRESALYKHYSGFCAKSCLIMWTLLLLLY